MFRRRIAAAVAIAVCVPLIGACGGNEETGAEGPVTITFWHSMASANGEALQHIVDEYNRRNDGKIRVEAVYQGKYGDTVNKLLASIKARQTPNLVQVYEIGTKLMIDTKAIVPFADLAQQAGFSTADIQPGAARYYTVDGKLQSLPFNASAPMLYYNKTAFKEAGLDPEKPPTTLDELQTAAEKLTIRSGNTVSRYGMVAAVDGWLVEQMLANGDVTYCDNDNGRSGTATSVTWDNDTLKKIVTTWAGLIRDGYGLNVGRNNTDASAAFQAGRAAMLPFTSANLRDIIKGSKFEVGVANFIKPLPGTGGGVFNGGASIWTMAGHPKREQDAAVDFLRYLASPETQAFWAAQTGYIPLNVKAVDEPAFKEVLSTYPDFAKPGEQLAKAAESAASRGCLMGAMPQARSKMNDVLESVILGKATPEKAVADAQAEVAAAIEAYNKSVG